MVVPLKVTGIESGVEASLDPRDWEEFREQAHRMLDDILTYTERIRERPVWQESPEAVREGFRKKLPRRPVALAELHGRFLREILPYAAGNAHPGFFGWVHGGGTPVGMLAEMLAAGLNANVAGRNQVPVLVERQVVEWMRELFGFPEGAGGLFVTGTSAANLVAVLVARAAALGTGVRSEGVGGQRLVGYVSEAAHGSIAQAMDVAGLGTRALRRIPVDEAFRMDVGALEEAIAADRGAGLRPFFVAGNAGTVDTGAVDDLAGIGRVARREGMWFHVDGAFGALAMLAPDLAGKLSGIERADSIAFDFHKWGQVPYDAGFVLIRDGGLQERTFASEAGYLRREGRGLAAGSPWPCDLGFDQSRGFRALKVWFTLQAYGTERLGRVISGTCGLARYLEERIEEEPELELAAPVGLNIVCFRYRCEDSDGVNREIAADLQESGIAAPSTTVIGGRTAIRVAVVNHRTRKEDIDRLVRATLELGAERVPRGAWYAGA
jgi:aromatic-L-amino-acid decarboxylase